MAPSLITFVFSPCHITCVSRENNLNHHHHLISFFIYLFVWQSYAEREHGKVVVYTTSMGVVRQTFQRCLQVQRILGTLLINYEERDVSMNRQVQQELKERMNRNRIVIPQVFVEGQLLGVSHTLFYFVIILITRQK